MVKKCKITDQVLDSNPCKNRISRLDIQKEYIYIYIYIYKQFGEV